MKSIRRGFKNSFRNVTRSVGIIFILAIAIALSISMLIARDAVNKKIDSVRATTGNSIVVTPKGFFGFQGSGTPLTTSQVNGLLNLNNVTAVQESLSERLSSTQTSLTPVATNGRFTGGFGGFGGGDGSSVRLIGTNSPGNAVVGGANGGGTETLTSGTTFSPTSSANVAIVGTTLATANNLKVGSTFTIGTTKVTVVGIFSAGSTFTDASVLMPLTTVQNISDAPGQVTAATVVVNSVNNVASTASAITKKIGSVADVTSTQQIVQSELSPLNTVNTISTYTLVGSVIGAAIILLLSMLMIVRERRREIGVLKAIGAPSRSIVTQFIAESTTFTILGSIVGFLIGVVISSPIASALVSASGGSTGLPGGFVRRGGGFGGGGSGFTPPVSGGGGGLRFAGGGFRNVLGQLHVSIGWSTFAYALLAAVVIAAIGSTVATSAIVRIRPAEVLRSE